MSLKSVSKQLPLEYTLLMLIASEFCIGHACIKAEGLTHDSEREAVAKGGHLIICAAAIYLKDGHAYELCQERRP